ncbi:MAG: DUF2130 domain-containing protein [Flavobacteriales bacterium]|nr:DUF2130 domain-containing protein [Flavobacteriales bacterium]
MNKQTEISCPNCGESIDVNDVLTHQLEDELKKKYNHRLAEERKKYEAKNEENEKKLESKEKALKQQEEEFEEKKKKQNELFQEKLDRKLREEKSELEKKLKHKLQEEQEDRFKMMQNELNEKQEKLKELNQKKAEIEKLKREKDAVKEEAEAAAQKKINEQLKVESERIRKSAGEAYELKLREMQKQLEDQKKLTEDMRRKQEQGSMQLQGEVQELALEDELRGAFPFDLIEEVTKGMRGADCLQTVVNNMQQECGKIIFESKRTQNFAGDWIPKLKADMLAAGADVAVLVTETLPKGQKQFALVNGVWVCSFKEFVNLTAVLREGIMKVHAAQDANINKGDKMQMLYSYLTGNEFRHQMEAIVEGFSALKDELEKEKRLMNKRWKEREKQIEKVTLNTLHLYGSVKGIAGSSVKSIPELDMDDDENLLEEGED